MAAMGSVVAIVVDRSELLEAAALGAWYGMTIAGKGVSVSGLVTERAKRDGGEAEEVRTEIWSAHVFFGSHFDGVELRVRRVQLINR